MTEANPTSVLEEKILPADVVDISNNLSNQVDTLNIFSKFKNWIISFINTLFNGIQNFLKTEYFIVWLIILFSSLLYTSLLYGITSIMMSGDMLFSLIILIIIYLLPDSIPNILKSSSNKNTFIPYHYNNERFTNKKYRRRNVEIY